MSKSAIYTANTTTTTVTPTNIIPLGTTVRRYGCNIIQEGNAITVTGKGYYFISGTITLEPTAVGDVSVSALVDGVNIVGATGSGAIATVGDSVTIPITAIVRNTCDCVKSAITFVLNEGTANVTNIAVNVIKL